MPYLKIASAVAAVLSGPLLIASGANATITSTGLRPAADTLAVVDHVQFRYGGHRHCWYPGGWHGPGWYWCGYGHRHGLGWGGGEGWQGWRHR
jgi:hypothetical protein